MGTIKMSVTWFDAVEDDPTAGTPSATIGSALKF
jgi:hypothetical protein